MPSPSTERPQEHQTLEGTSGVAHGPGPGAFAQCPSTVLQGDRVEGGTTEQLSTHWHSPSWSLLYPSLPSTPLSCPCTPHLPLWASPHSGHPPQGSAGPAGCRAHRGRDAAPLPQSIPWQSCSQELWVDSWGVQGQHPLLSETACRAYLSVMRDRPPALGQHREAEARKNRASLGPVCCGTHSTYPGAAPAVPGSRGHVRDKLWG